MATQGIDPLAESDRLEYFDALHRGFERAAQRAGETVEHYFEIAGQIVCVRFAGDGLAPHLTGALAHLAVPPRTPALTICVWDDVSTGTRLPLLVGSLVTLLRDRWWELIDRRREIREYDGRRIRTSFFLGPDILSALDMERNLGLYWIQSEDRLPYWERGSPFLALLSWWMASRDRHYVHAGAVGHADGGVLLAGKGGSGKSTSALASLSAGLAYASDDYCLVADRPAPFVHSVYGTAKLKGRADFDRFPHLRERCSNLERVGDEKALLFLREHYPERLVSGFPIRAVLLPRITDQPHARLKDATSAEAFRALAPSTLLQVPGAGPGLLQALGRLVKQVPAYHLELGADPESIPKAIESVLAMAGTPS